MGIDNKSKISFIFLQNIKYIIHTYTHKI